MTSKEIRQKFIDFYKAHGHKQIPSAPLVLENDPTTLFTSSGMQPLIPYLMGQPHPLGKRLVDSQPAVRTIDIDEVGDNSHLTYFEMLGNWSLGDYFKKEQLMWFWEFLTKELSLPGEKLWVSVFEGTKDVPKDETSVTIWKKLGVPTKRIFYYGVEKNWWSRSGTPKQMPIGEIGGPDSEVFYEFDLVKHDPKFGKTCHPNCNCGRFVEIGNSVFIQYKKEKDGSLKELPQKNVDFGGGLERISAVVQQILDVYKTELYQNFVKRIEKISGQEYEKNITAFRIIADHMRASNALISEGVIPGNKLQGYVLRRLIRRSALKIRILKGNLENTDLNFDFESNIKVVIEEEVQKFSRTFEKGLKLLGKTSPFDLFQTYGFPPELTEELTREKGLEFNKEEFKNEFEKHKQLSRSASAGMFKGGLGGHSDIEIKYHTATHLLHQALRDILGKHVHQAGSNINRERLRFDFTHPTKLTRQQIKKVEELVKQKIKDDLPVTKQEMNQNQALKEGALAFFPEKYPQLTSVYTIGPLDNWYSKELCGGPHVDRTGVIGRVRIIKEESVSSGVRRIYATIG